MAGERILKVLFTGDTSKLDSAVKGLGGSLGDVAKVAAGVAIGEKLPEGIKGAIGLLDQGAVSAGQLQAQLGLTSSEAERFGSIAQSVYRDNFGESVTDTTAAVAQAMQQFGDVGDGALKGITENAFRLRDAFGVDTSESIDAVKTLMTNFGLTSDQAFDMIAKGFQKGLNRSGDFLDTIGEYSTQFSNGGANAEQFFSLLESGMQGGVLGTDKAADAFKEFRVRIQDGSKTTSDGLKSLGIDADKLAKGMADGSITAADAFQLVVGKLRDTDDANLRMQAGVALLGTQFEDLGQKGATALDLTGDSFSDAEGAAASLDAQYAGVGSTIEGMKRQFLGFITDGLGPLSPVLAGATGQLIELTGTFGPLIPALTSIVPLILAKAGAWAAAAVAEGTALLPMIAIAAAIAALVAGIVILIKHWGDLEAKYPPLKTATENIKAAFEALTTWITGTFVPTVEKIASTVSKVVGDAVAFVRDHWHEIQDIIDPAVKALEVIVNTWFKQIQTDIETILGVIKGIVDVFMGIFTGDWDRAWKGVKEIVSSIWNGMKETIENTIGLIKGLAPLILEAGLALGGALKDGIVEGIKGIAGSIGDLTQALIDAFKSAVNSALRWLHDNVTISVPGFDGPGPVDIPGFDWHFPLIQLAKGGIVNRPTVALIGEAGPEAVVPLTGANAPALGGVTVNMYGTTVYARDEDEARRAANDIGYGLIPALRARGLRA